MYHTVRIIRHCETLEGDAAGATARVSLCVALIALACFSRRSKV